MDNSIEGGGVFINREIEVEEREGLKTMERNEKRGNG
jgi:hypothetical protein